MSWPETWSITWQSGLKCCAVSGKNRFHANSSKKARYFQIWIQQRVKCEILFCQSVVTNYSLAVRTPVLLQSLTNKPSDVWHWQSTLLVETPWCQRMTGWFFSEARMKLPFVSSSLIHCQASSSIFQAFRILPFLLNVWCFLKAYLLRLWFKTKTLNVITSFSWLWSYITRL